MTSVLPYQYEFIPNDTSLFENEGECVVDQISKSYGDQIKALRPENLIQRIYDAEEASTGVHSDPDRRLVDGVRARTINGILKSPDISYYSYDIHTRCYDKFISKNRDYPALVYYSAHNHTYIVR